MSYNEAFRYKHVFAKPDSRSTHHSRMTTSSMCIRFTNLPEKKQWTHSNNLSTPPCTSKKGVNKRAVKHSAVRSREHQHLEQARSLEQIHTNTRKIRAIRNAQMNDQKVSIFSAKTSMTKKDARLVERCMIVALGRGK